MAGFVTHLLSDEPTEFHVLASLLAEKPLFVATRNAMWRVADGRISVVDRRDSHKRQAAGRTHLPIDKDRQITADQLVSYEKAILPYIAEAKATYPEAKQRFLTGLPADQMFLVTTRLYDRFGRYEQAYISVSAIKDGIIYGRINSNINLVSGYKTGDQYSFPERDIIDWTILHRNGIEEGNFVGKFLDSFKPSAARQDATDD